MYDKLPHLLCNALALLRIIIILTVYGITAPVLDQVVVLAIVSTIASDDHGMSQAGAGALSGTVHTSRIVLNWRGR